MTGTVSVLSRFSRALAVLGMLVALELAVSAPRVAHADTAAPDRRADAPPALEPAGSAPSVAHADTAVSDRRIGDPGAPPSLAPAVSAPRVAHADTAVSDRRIGDPGAPPSPAEVIAQALADEATAIERALAVVTDKLAGVDEIRRKRVRAAYRAITPSPGEDVMAVARRRAAARLVLERDAGERTLLVDEAARLRTARLRVAADQATLPSLRFPVALAPPAPGKIVRHFGTLVHERSKAMLSRRGIDLEVDDRRPVTAPAAGTVRYAGPIRGLDQGVIIDHGTFVTVLAKLGDVALPIGTQITAGDRIGRAARHRVYFEVRLKLGPGGMPLDPEPLLTKLR
jgi:murein DD-endopeptidase MepM/ murein hydrolase activator NlpD